jgi:hypothetical protein
LDNIKPIYLIHLYYFLNCRHVPVHTCIQQVRALSADASKDADQVLPAVSCCTQYL